MSVEPKDKSARALAPKAELRPQDFEVHPAPVECQSADLTEQEVFDQYVFPKTLLDEEKQFAIEGKFLGGIFGAKLPERLEREDLITLVYAAVAGGLSDEGLRRIVGLFEADDHAVINCRDVIKIFQSCQGIAYGQDGMKLARGIAEIYAAKKPDISFATKTRLIKMVMKKPNPGPLMEVVARHLVALATDRDGNFNQQQLHMVLDGVLSNNWAAGKIPEFLDAVARTIPRLAGNYYDFNFAGNLSLEEVNELYDFLGTDEGKKADPYEVCYFGAYKLLREMGCDIKGSDIPLVHMLLSALGADFLKRGYKNLVTAVGKKRAEIAMLDLAYQPGSFRKLCRAYEGYRDISQDALLFISATDDFTSIEPKLATWNVIWVDDPKKAVRYIKASERNDMYFFAEGVKKEGKPVRLAVHENMFRKFIKQSAQAFFTAFELKRFYRINKPFFFFMKSILEEAQVWTLTEAHAFAAREMFIIYPNGEEIMNIAYGLRCLGREKVLEMYKKTGMVLFGRFSPDVLNRLYADLDSDSPENKNKPVFVRVMPTADWNGAEYFSIVDPEDVDNLFENYRVIVIESAVPQLDLADYLRGLLGDGALIDKLVFSAHGSPTNSSFGDARRAYYATKNEWSLDISDKEFFKEIKSYLNEGAQIFMMSCSTGKGKNALAAKMSAFIKDVAIYAPSDDTGALMTASAEGEVEISFTSARKRKFLNGKVVWN